jgi:hypothetical protein
VKFMVKLTGSFLMGVAVAGGLRWSVVDVDAQDTRSNEIQCKIGSGSKITRWLKYERMDAYVRSIFPII